MAATTDMLVPHIKTLPEENLGGHPKLYGYEALIKAGRVICRVPEGLAASEVASGRMVAVEVAEVPKKPAGQDGVSEQLTQWQTDIEGIVGGEGDNTVKKEGLATYALMNFNEELNKTRSLENMKKDAIAAAKKADEASRA